MDALNIIENQENIIGNYQDLVAKVESPIDHINGIIDHILTETIHKLEHFNPVDTKT